VRAKSGQPGTIQSVRDRHGRERRLSRRRRPGDVVAAVDVARRLHVELGEKLNTEGGSVMTIRCSRRRCDREAELQSAPLAVAGEPLSDHRLRRTICS
jgi:hypothetical protein